MISVRRHPNFENWIEVKDKETLIDQFSSLLQAVVFAKKIAKEKKMEIVLDIKDVKLLR
jgi:hypothetical protein